MATNNSELNLGQLDFDGIKNSLKTFLKSQSEFTDYDFEGSGINILLDILAANTHFFGYYGNMVANESFLDTASTRDGVVSIARLLGYTPRSVTAAKATVTVNFGTTQPTENGFALNFLPSGSIFRATVNRETFNFITRQPYPIVLNSDGNYVAENVEIIEGYVNFSNFVVDESNGDQRFVIRDANIDTSTIVVRVQRSIQDTTGFEEVWRKNSDFVSIGPDSRVFFLEEAEDRYFRVFFGDGILGQKPRNGNVITIQYLVTSGEEANGVGRNDKATSRVFKSINYPNSVVSVQTSASGGSSLEDLNSIKYNAPRSFQAQNRAVTSEDYRNIVFSEYPDAESVYVYGGEDADPPQYGKVFVAIKPKEGATLTAIEKNNLANSVIKTRNVLGITPEIVDPDILYLNVTCEVTYDPAKTSLSETDIESKVVSVIRDFSNNQLSKFDNDLVFSKFTRYIDSSDVSIIGNQTTLTLQKRITPQLGQVSSYTLDFNNPILYRDGQTSPVVSSTGFNYLDTDGETVVEAFLDDDSNGNIRIYKILNGVKTIINDSIGTVNYTTGVISLIDFAPASLSGSASQLYINCVPQNQNVLTKRNTILTIDETDSNSISVNAVIDNVTTTRSTNSGVSFPFNAG